MYFSSALTEFPHNGWPVAIAATSGKYHTSSDSTMEGSVCLLLCSCLIYYHVNAVREEFCGDLIEGHAEQSTPAWASATTKGIRRGQEAILKGHRSQDVDRSPKD